MAKARSDPMARRHGESHWQHAARLAEMKAANERAGEKIVTAEALARGGLVQETVWHQEANSGAKTLRRNTTSALAMMRDKGSLSDEQYYSALQIARIIERIERNASIGCASLEARVDCSNSSRNAVVESLYDVRLERAYTEWRTYLPMPKRMVLDMIMRDHRLAAVAAYHRCGWPKAQRLLRNALDQWPECFARQMREIKQDDVDAAHQRLRNI